MIQTDIDYPKSLPCPAWDGYDLNHVQPFKRTPMVSGRSRQRRSSTSVPTMAAVDWVFRGAETQAFEAWFRDTLNDGDEWFNMPLRTPLGNGSYACRFAEMYKGLKPVGMDHWRTTAVLEIYERPLLPRGWGLAADYVARQNLIDLALNKYWPKA